MLAFRSSSLRKIRRFRENRRASISIEFAAIVPFMVTLLWGVVELQQYLSALNKITLLRSTLTDVFAQATLAADSADYPQSTTEDILEAASSILDPFPSSKLAFAIFSYQVDASVDFDTKKSEILSSRSCASFVGPNSKFASESIPTTAEALFVQSLSKDVTVDLASEQTVNVLYSYVHYDYSPPSLRLFTSGSVKIERVFFSLPRSRKQIRFLGYTPTTCKKT